MFLVTFEDSQEHKQEQQILDQNHFKQILLDMKQEVSGRISSIDRDIRHEGMSADWSEQPFLFQSKQISRKNSWENFTEIINYEAD